jgi:hypothetical protein
VGRPQQKYSPPQINLKLAETMWYLLITLTFTGVGGPETAAMRMGKYMSGEDCRVHQRFLYEVLFEKSSNLSKASITCLEMGEEKDS